MQRISSSCLVFAVVCLLFGSLVDAQSSSNECEDNPTALEWCRYLEKVDADRRGCNSFQRSVSSSAESTTIVFKLLENLWHNCPKTCFNCDLHNNPRVPESLITKSEKYLRTRVTDETLRDKVQPYSPNVDIDRWLEVNAVLEHLYVCENAEDAANDGEVFDESSTSICEKWKDELKSSQFKTLPDGTVTCDDISKPNSTDAIVTYNLPNDLKDGMHWWCRETCNLCSRQDNVVSHHYFSF